jgi:tRNA(Ile)-lysidine synthase
VGYVTDPSNSDERFTRNRIRARLLPALEAVFPQFRDTFARSAAHAAQAQILLDEVATQDLVLIGTPPLIARLHTLSRARQANVLRHWLRGSFDTAPSAAQLQELLDQIAACTTRGHRLHLKVGAGFVRREGAVLSWYNPTV